MPRRQTRNENDRARSPRHAHRFPRASILVRGRICPVLGCLGLRVVRSRSSRAGDSGSPPDITRKAVLACPRRLAHVLAVSRPGVLGAPSSSLAGALYLSFRYEILAAIEDEGPTLGSVLAPLQPRAPDRAPRNRLRLTSRAPAPLAMVGDGAAALLGRRRGTRRYHLFGHPRTMEGTLTLFLVASASMAPVLGLLGGLDWHQAVAFALDRGNGRRVGRDDLRPRNRQRHRAAFGRGDDPRC